MRFAYEAAPPIAKGLSWQTVEGDYRKYLKLGGSGLLALRARGFRSWETTPDFLYMGGNSEMRGYDYLEFAGQNVVFGNAELRFPLINAMATPVGVLGGIRGVAFFNVGGGWWDNSGYKFLSSKNEVYNPLLGYNFNPITGVPYTDLWRLLAVGGSSGRRTRPTDRLATFALGFPIHRLVRKTLQQERKTCGLPTPVVVRRSAVAAPVLDR